MPSAPEQDDLFAVPGHGVEDPSRRTAGRRTATLHPLGPVEDPGVAEEIDAGHVRVVIHPSEQDRTLGTGTHSGEDAAPDGTRGETGRPATRCPRLAAERPGVGENDVGSVVERGYLTAGDDDLGAAGEPRRDSERPPATPTFAGAGNEPPVGVSRMGGRTFRDDHGGCAAHEQEPAGPSRFGHDPPG